MIFGASKIETKTTITSSGGEVTLGDLTADLRTSISADFNNVLQNVARDLCAGTLPKSVLDNVEIVYLAENRSAYQSTEIKTVEVKNPSALTIKFIYNF